MGGRVLIVDDHDANLRFLERHLISEGFDAVSTTSSLRAIEMINRERFDFVLLDLLMVELSGLETLRRIREKHSRFELPVMMVTADVDGASIVEALNSGANDYITKPIDLDVLSARVRTLSEWMHSTRELEKAKDEALAATRAKSSFISNMSHEIRTPLNVIIGMTDVLKETKLNDEQLKLVYTIYSAGSALLAIINDILDLSKLEVGKLHIEEIPFQLQELARESCAMFEVSAQKKGVTLSLDLDLTLTGSFLGDPTRLRQVIFNLVGNAIKFTAQGSVRLSIRKSREGRVHFEVEDTGVGIPEDKLSGIFERFSQADGSVTRKYGGTGLGLPICKRLVEMMGGHLQVKSQVGRGSVFLFDLPLMPVASSELPVQRETVSPHKIRDGLCGRKILIVDDVQENRDLIRLFLSAFPVQMVDAASGIEAIDLLRHDVYDLILMDVQMPGMSGLEATSEIRRMEKLEDRSPAKIVALTAQSLEEEERAARDAGCDAFIRKPIRKKQFLESLALVMSQSAASAASHPSKAKAA